VSIRRTRGFTLVEVLVALAVIAMGLAALMTAVSGTASASGYLREKAQAQWIALNRIVEVRLNQQKFGASTDIGDLDYANKHWHYDTRYFDTSIATMQRVVVRVWAGTADTKSNPLAESTGFIGTSLATQGGSNVDWTRGSTVPAPTSAKSAAGSLGALPGTGNPPANGAPAIGAPAIGAPAIGAPPGIGASPGIGGSTPLGGDFDNGGSSSSGSSSSGSDATGSSGSSGDGSGNDTSGNSP
jgi:general secretion pathway protein I